MKISIFTGGTSVRLKNIFTDISQYPTGEHEIKLLILNEQKVKERQNTNCKKIT